MSTHAMNCPAGSNWDSECSCGLKYQAEIADLRAQLEQANMQVRTHSDQAWMNRVTELEKRLEQYKKRQRLCENGTHEIAESGECCNCALRVKLPTERLDLAEAVIAAARCIKHWHDTHNEGMIVSAKHVFALWEALKLYDAAISQSKDQYR